MTNLALNLAVAIVALPVGAFLMGVLVGAFLAGVWLSRQAKAQERPTLESEPGTAAVQGVFFCKGEAFGQPSVGKGH